jgi:hypothetical protein
MRGQSGFAPLRGNDFPKPLQHNVWSQIIMTFSERLSDSDEQTSALSRRDLLGKFSAITVTATGAKLLPQIAIPAKYPLPQFSIGDLVAENWTDEFDKEQTDFGEILGVRWLPEGHSCFEANTWVYYIYWTHSTCGSEFCYPCYDGEPTRGCDLRLV